MKPQKIVYALIGVVVIGVFVFFANSRQAVLVDHAKSRAAGPSSGKQLVFSDDFYGTALNRQNWETCYDWKKPAETGCTNGGNFEQQWYTSGQVSVKDGGLILSAVHQPIDVAVDGRAKSFAYQSGMLNSGPGSTGSNKAHWAGIYGYYEARIQVQKGQGVWPAFWLLPTDRQWPPEIDIMEFVGSKPGQILQTLHWVQDAKPVKSESVIAKIADYSDNWHTYGLDWEPGRVDWYIDGVKTKTYTGSDVPSKPMEIILDLAVGGQLPGNADASTPFPRHMKVDYVRVFQASSQARPTNR